MLRKTYGETNNFYRVGSSPFVECSEVIEQDSYRSVVIKRDPISRAISCFADKFVYREGPLLHPQDFEPFTRRLYRDYAILFDQDRKRNNTITFETYLETVMWQMHQRQDPNENDQPVNGHWDTQVPPAALDFEYDHIFDVSEVSTSFDELCTSLGLAGAGEAKNRARYEQNEHGYLGDVPAQELATMSVTKENFRSERTDRLIRYLYAIDYLKFGNSNADG